MLLRKKILKYIFFALEPFFISSTRTHLSRLTKLRFKIAQPTDTANNNVLLQQIRVLSVEW